MTAHIIHVPTFRQGYRTVIDHVLEYGVRRAPRGALTLDAGHTTIAVHDPLDALAVGVGRKLSPLIAAAEAVQLIGGFSDPWLMPRSFDTFRNPDGSFHGAYGPRAGYQAEEVVRKLQDDSSTRQAVITVWDPILDNSSPTPPDIPCTVALIFEIRPRRHAVTGFESNFLELSVVMRSNDLWRGLPYDVFQFTQLQVSVARALGVVAGAYRHTAVSLHIYETDLTKVNDVTAGVPHLAPNFEHITGVGNFFGDENRTGNELWDIITQRARQLVHRLPSAPSDSERWYRDALRSRNDE